MLGNFIFVMGKIFTTNVDVNGVLNDRAPSLVLNMCNPDAPHPNAIPRAGSRFSRLPQANQTDLSSYEPLVTTPAAAKSLMLVTPVSSGAEETPRGWLTRPLAPAYQSSNLRPENLPYSANFRTA